MAVFMYCEVGIKYLYWDCRMNSKHCLCTYTGENFLFSSVDFLKKFLDLFAIVPIVEYNRSQ